MLTTTMTPQEMLAEMRRDDKEVHALNMRFLASGGAKHLLKEKNFPQSINREIVTSRGNRYITCITFLDKQHLYEKNTMETRRAVINTEEGLAMLAVIWNAKFDKNTIFYFRPHVFKRYKERMKFKQEGIALIKVFCKRNSDMILQDDYKHKEGDMEKDVMLTVVDGALFGTTHPQDETCYVINTFIANETMQEGYKHKFNKTHNESVDVQLEAYKYLLPDYMLLLKKRKE